MNYNQKVLDHFVIKGVLSSIIISLVLYITGVETISSIMVALLGVVITLQIDLISRIEQALHKNKQYFELGNKLESMPWLHSSILSIINSTNIIMSKSKNSLFKESAKHEVEKCRNLLDEIKQGYLKTDFIDIDPLITALKETKNSLRAISVSNVDDKFWNSSIGKKFWNENIKAVQDRNVFIERIFIYDEWNKKLEELIQKQIDVGIKVSIISKSELPNNFCTDMIIYDEKFLYKAILNSNGIPIENLLSINKSDINHEIKNFNKTKNFAHDFDQKIISQENKL